MRKELFSRKDAKHALSEAEGTPRNDNNKFEARNPKQTGNQTNPKLEKIQNFQSESH